MSLIFDSHSHYDDSKFDDDRNDLLLSLKEKGVGYVLCAGTNMKSSREVSRLCRDYPFVFGSAGVHPIDCIGQNSPYLNGLEKMFSENSKLVAVGEIGLDYHYDDSPPELQKRFFEEQLSLAKKLDKPVIVHSREATADVMDRLREYRPKGIVHCFSGSCETAREVLDLGMYIGFTGVITFQNAQKVKKSAAYVPLDRLVIETDCPYMAPVPYRGQRCDSSMLFEVAEAIAQIKGKTRDEIIDITAQNAVKAYEMEELI